MTCAHRLDGITPARAAAAYCKLGFAVLPLEPGEKRPGRVLGRAGGVHHASREQAQAAEWALASPRCNLGVACGQPSGLVVIDVDVKAADGRASWAGFGQETGLHVPDAPVVSTPSGGFHLWLRWPGWWGPCKGRIGILPGVDVKGDGGYVAVPPSALYEAGPVPGRPVVRPYRWASGCPCQAPDAPGWMRDWLARPAPAAADDSEAAEAIDLAGLEAGGFDPGRRNIQCYRAALALFTQYPRGTGAYAQVRARIRAMWAATPGHDDFTWAEAVACLDSAWRWMRGREQAEDPRPRRWAHLDRPVPWG